MAKKTSDDEPVKIPDPPEVKIGEWVVHPFRYFVPEMPPEKYAQLLANLEKTRKPSAFVTVDQQRRVVDGRAQLRACLKLKIEPLIVRAPAADEPAHYVMGTMGSTPYTSAQANVVAASLMAPLELEARNRQVHAKQVGEKFPKGGGRAAYLAADLVHGSNGKWVARARQMIADNDPVLEQIRNGKVTTMTHVIDLLDSSPGKKAAKIERLKAGEPEHEVFPKPKVIDDLWLTPPKITEAIRHAFGGEIALDPCGPEESGSHVKASTTYTKTQNGLDYDKSPWFDRTFVNPPFSKQELWILRALRAAKAGMRVYMLLPVSPGSMHQQALVNKAWDVLYLRGRVPFLKPGGAPGGAVGKKDIMIAGLGISTRPLLEMGLRGTITSTPADQRKALRIISELEWVFEDFPPSEPVDVAEVMGDYEHPEVTAEEKADAERVNRENQTAYDANVSAGRDAVAKAIRDEEAAAEVRKQQNRQNKKKAKT